MMMKKNALTAISIENIKTITNHEFFIRCLFFLLFLISVAGK